MLLFYFLTSSPDSFYHRHQIGILKKKLNTKIEIHDLSNILNKDWNKAFINKRHKIAKVFENINDWEIYLKKLLLKKEKFLW